MDGFITPSCLGLLVSHDAHPGTLVNTSAHSHQPLSENAGGSITPPTKVEAEWLHYPTLYHLKRQGGLLHYPIPQGENRVVALPHP